jgi:hypothetical protein
MRLKKVRVIGKKGCQVVLQFVWNQVHEAVHMQRVVLVRHLHCPRLPQTPHVEQAVIADWVEAARHDVRRRQVLERVHEQRGHLRIEHTSQIRCLKCRVAIRMLLLRANTSRYCAILCSHQNIDLQL